MFLSRAILPALAAVALAGPALAQTQWVEIADDIVLQPWNASVDKVDDWDVMGAGGTKVGEVEEVVGTTPGAPTALVVDFEEDAGFGDRDVVIPLDRFTYANNVLTLNADAAAITPLETYND